MERAVSVALTSSLGGPLVPPLLRSLLSLLFYLSLALTPFFYLSTALCPSVFVSLALSLFLFHPCVCVVSLLFWGFALACLLLLVRNAFSLINILAACRSARSSSGSSRSCCNCCCFCATYLLLLHRQQQHGQSAERE